MPYLLALMNTVHLLMQSPILVQVYNFFLLCHLASSSRHLYLCHPFFLFPSNMPAVTIYLFIDVFFITLLMIYIIDDYIIDDLLRYWLRDRATEIHCSLSNRYGVRHGWRCGKFNPGTQRQGTLGQYSLHLFYRWERISSVSSYALEHHREFEHET